MEYVKYAFTINFSDYENLNVNLPINVLLLIFFVGICVSFIAVDFNRRYLFLLVRQLSRHDARTEDKGKSLKEIGLGESRIIKFLLGRGGHIRRVVRIQGRREYTYEEYVALNKTRQDRKEFKKSERIDFETARFYIAPDMQDRAKTIMENYNTSLLKTLFICLMFMVIYVCIMLAMPEFLNLLNTLAGNMKG